MIPTYKILTPAEVESLYCCQAQVLSWAYILLSLVCPLRSLPLLSGRHKPEEEERLDWGVESIPGSGSVLSLASHEEDATSCRSEPQSQVRNFVLALWEYDFNLILASNLAQRTSWREATQV